MLGITRRGFQFLRNKNLHTSSIVVKEFGSPDVMKYVENSHEIRDEIKENEILVKVSAAVRRFRFYLSLSL